MNRLTQDVETILEQAVEIASADERRAFVEQACGGDLALQGRVEKLIADYFQAGSFLERPAVAMDGLLYLLDSSVPPVVSQPTVSSPFMDRLGVEGTVREFDGTAAAQPADTQAATAVFDAAALVSTGTSPVIPGYTIEGELGRGGMGVVYRARTTKLDRSVALKMILAAEHAGHEAAVRFLAEAQAIARVQHPNIVQIFHIDQHGGHPYFEMEYVGGGSLAARLDGSPRPPREAARLLEILARAMAEAHRQGIVHRDLKPANILLTQDGVPKVADFGLAKVMNVESGLTRTDSVMGSPSYMAPEQAGGKTKVVGPAADLYALGVILYELLTGRPPFQGATLLETLEQLKTREPVPPSRLVPGLPRDVETIVLKCLRKDPDERYASAWELAEDLARFQCGEPILARPVAWPERTWRWCQRNAALTSSLAAIALTMAAAIVVTLFFWLRAEKARIAEAARARSETSAKLDADAARRDVQRQLIDLCGASGLKAAQDGDHSLALLWFARAVQLAGHEPAQEELNRIRVTNWQRQVCLPEATFTVAGFQAVRDLFETLAFSPDGNYLLAVVSTRECVVWDRRRSQCVSLPSDAANGTAAVWQPATGLLAVAGRDGRVRLLAPPEFRPVDELVAAWGVTVLGFSRDSKLLAWGGREGARVWNTSTKSYITDLLAHPKPVNALSFSAAGDLLATSSRDFKARVFRVSAGKGEPLFSPVPHISNRSGSNHGGPGRTAPRFAAKDRVVLTVEKGEPQALVWRSALTGEVLPANVAPDYGGTLGAFAVSPVGNHVVAFWDHDGRLLDAETRGMLAVIPTARQDAWCEDAIFADDGKTVVTGGQDGLLRFWSLEDRATFALPENAPPIRHPMTVVQVALSSDGRHTAAALKDGRICLWNFPQGPPRAFALPPGGPTQNALSTDGQLILTRSISYRGATKLEARVYRADSGEPAGPALSPGGILIDATFSPDGGRVATASSSAQTPLDRNNVVFALDGAGGNVQLWDWKSGKRLGGPIPTPGEPRGLAFRPDGKSLAVVCADNRILLVDPVTGSISHRLDPGVRSRPENANLWWSNGEARFSPDGRFLVTWELAPVIHVWKASTGQLLHVLPHNDRVESVDFNANSPNLMISGGRDLVLRVWDLSLGKTVAQLPHPNWVRGNFSCDGTEVISLSNGMLRFWDWRTAKLKEGLALYPAALMDFHFTADRTALVSLSMDELQVTDWRTKTPCTPAFKLPRGPHFALTVPAGDRRAIVGGFAHEVAGYDFGAMRTPALAPAEDLVRAAELASARQILSQGLVVPLSNSEWAERLERYRSLGAQPETAE